MQPLKLINTIPIFEEVQQELIKLLASLTKKEWNSPTISTQWNVKDVAAHLLDGDLRRLSIHRDHHELPPPEEPIRDYTSLVNFLNAVNNEWVRAAKRLSPKLIIELTEFLTPKVMEHLKNLDPKGRAKFSVDWAGEEQSENWFDIAREYTEKWHHQQQIREAVGRPNLVEKKWLEPLIDTLIRGVPPVYDRHAGNISGESVLIHVTEVIDDTWLLVNQGSEWKLYKAEADDAAGTEVSMDDDTAWRIFTKNISESEALNRITVKGNEDLGALITKTVSFMK
ncbi:MAG: maleylpyruvate isomerase N-terminal domain-containing protein [Gracilimonas sp.]|uniref:maleylpyruvate isomerase N-terminal domain-containing protein n=1 Tax=Gracilimonas sp. TaxID=1974203 RepID=UPI001996F480|nr:maleylpyruvate isomerase N-terminal domain-containing protein [Gracilimonas sp.]MBD3616134.1 maleylpyruvate isomerase N-terminal domain-containing protein [Gracilimonas sp.]